jgi:hypothetical protein
MNDDFCFVLDEDGDREDAKARTGFFARLRAVLLCGLWTLFLCV